MKEYGESIFDILYLLLAITVGLLILIRSKNNKQRLMGIACLVLGGGDAFHLVPRMLGYFAEGDFNTAVGVGKLVTSITMTVFYVLMYHIWLRLDGAAPDRPVVRRGKVGHEPVRLGQAEDQSGGGHLPHRGRPHLLPGSGDREEDSRRSEL